MSVTTVGPARGRLNGRCSVNSHATLQSHLDSITAHSTALTRELLRDRIIPGINPRVTRGWKEAMSVRAGGPGREMALWFRAFPQHLPRWVAYWRVVMMESPAPVEECMSAVLAARHEHDDAAIAAIRDMSPANLLRWARASELLAARHAELARAVRDSVESQR